MIDYKECGIEEDEPLAFSDWVYAACFICIFFGLIAFATVG